jgi:hypothetical protein
MKPTRLKLAAASGALAILGGAAITSLSDAPHADALERTRAAASTISQPVAANNALQGLKQQHPSLDLTRATPVIDDGVSTVYLIDGSDEICLLERIKPAAPNGPNTLAGGEITVSSRFACKTRAAVASEGLLGGVPGDFYVYAPDGVTEARGDASDGTKTAIPVTARAFRVPSGTRRVTVGSSEPMTLPDN